MRTLTARLLSPLLRLTGVRFSKRYRWEETRYHSLVFQYVDTVQANMRADSDWRYYYKETRRSQPHSTEEDRP